MVGCTAIVLANARSCKLGTAHTLDCCSQATADPVIVAVASRAVRRASGRVERLQKTHMADMEAAWAPVPA